MIRFIMMAGVSANWNALSAWRATRLRCENSGEGQRLPAHFVSFLAEQTERNTGLGLEPGSGDFFPARFATAVGARIDPLESVLDFFPEEELAVGDGSVDFHGLQFSGPIATHKVRSLVGFVEKLLMIARRLRKRSQLLFQSFAEKGDVFGVHVPGKDMFS